MRLKPHHYVICSALTLSAACSDGTPVGTSATGGATGGGTATAGSSAGGSSAGTSSAGSGTSGSGGSVAGNASAGAGGGGAGGTTGGGGAGGATGGGGAGGIAGAGGAVVAVCGNGVKEDPEACDDGAKAPNDGCSATCTLETGYVCPTPGAACTPMCGDGLKIAPEKCDDKNATAGDGCSDTCTIEAGWECKTVGAACTTVCGDGILVGDELCDDKNTLPSDGCSATCTPEVGYICDIPGESCRKKPLCSGGACTSTCGDGIVLGEACDDGNTADNDGCSSACVVESGYTCTAGAAPAELAIPVIYRDFISVAAGGSTKFPDQQAFGAGQNATLGMVGPTLDVDGLPAYTGICEKGGPNAADPLKCPFGAQTTSKVYFDQWYRNTTDVNISLPGVLRASRVGQTQAYVFDSGPQFTPLTGKGWDAQGKEGLVAGKNFGFTTELRYFFVFQGDEVLDFSGDDDIWMFINGKLAVDIGGVHPSLTKTVTLGVAKSQELGLTPGKLYELSLFQAERQPNGSNFKLTLTGFASRNSKCTKL